MTMEEDDMRANDCPCGRHLGADDEGLSRLARAHVARDHPEDPADELIRDRVAADADHLERVG